MIDCVLDDVKLGATLSFGNAGAELCKAISVSESGAIIVIRVITPMALDCDPVS